MSTAPKPTDENRPWAVEIEIPPGSTTFYPVKSFATEQEAKGQVKALNKRIEKLHDKNDIRIRNTSQIRTGTAA